MVLLSWVQKRSYLVMKDTELTAYDQPWTVICPNGIVVGLFSEHDSDPEDRR